MIFRKLLSNSSRFRILTRTASSQVNTISDPAPAPNTVTQTGRRLKAKNQDALISEVRREFRQFLESTLGSSSQAQLTLDKMKEMLKRAVDVGDRLLFVGMLEAVPDDMLRQLDPEDSLLSYCIVKLSEASVQSQSLSAVLSRLPRYDPFLCDLVMGKIIEESNEKELGRFLSLIRDKKWPFVIERALEEQFIVDVYAPNCNFAEIKALFSKHSQWPVEVYSTALLSMVNPDPTQPLKPDWTEVVGFLGGCARGPNLAAAIEQLFAVHPPPDHILQKLTNLS